MYFIEYNSAGEDPTRISRQFTQKVSLFFLLLLLLLNVCVCVVSFLLASSSLNIKYIWAQYICFFCHFASVVFVFYKLCICIRHDLASRAH